MVYTCELCDFHTNGSIADLMAHIRGCHYVNVHPGNIHYAQCNNCIKTDGQCRRLDTFQALQEHLEEHDINVVKDWDD